MFANNPLPINIRMDNVRYVYHDPNTGLCCVKFYLEPKEIIVANKHGTFLDKITNKEDFFIHNVEDEELVVRKSDVKRMDDTGTNKVILNDETIIEVHASSYNSLKTDLNKI